MDVFKQNWGQRMQHDPYTNFVLNSDERADIGDPTQIQYWYLFSRFKPKMNIPLKEVDGFY